jgi:hypothetical protein
MVACHVALSSTGLVGWLVCLFHINDNVLDRGTTELACGTISVQLLIHIIFFCGESLGTACFAGETIFLEFRN